MYIHPLTNTVCYAPSSIDHARTGWKHAGYLQARTQQRLAMSLQGQNRGSFPSDESLINLFYLALSNISERWNRPIKDWKWALNRFSIVFEDRLYPSWSKPRLHKILDTLRRVLFYWLMDSHGTMAQNRVQNEDAFLRDAPTFLMVLRNLLAKPQAHDEVRISAQFDHRSIIQPAS